VQKCQSKKNSTKKSEQSLLAKLDKQLAEKELAPLMKTAVFEPLVRDILYQVFLILDIAY